MRTYLRHLFEKAQVSIWTAPLFYTCLIFALARYTLWLDEMGLRQMLVASDWFQISSVDSARALLSTIGTAVLSLAGISFSSILVSVTLASQQFGPRLLRNFLKDHTSQRTLGVLLATFLYCLYIQREIRDLESELYVPQLSVLTALILAVVCLGFFIAFVQSILTQIQGEHVVESAFHQLKGSIEAVFPDEDVEQTQQRPDPENEEGWDIRAGQLGYVQAISVAKLVEIATENDLELVTTVRSGHFVTPAQPVIRVTKGAEADELSEKTLEALQKQFLCGPVRTPEQDYEYGFRQLVEVACRALSPGINDPFTAMDCLEYLGAGLQLAFARPLPGSIHRDDEGTVRLTSWITDHQRLVDGAFDQIRQAGRDKCDVSSRLLEVLAKTARISNQADQQFALLRQAALVAANTPPALFNEHDRQAIRVRFEAVKAACDQLSADDFEKLSSV